MKWPSTLCDFLHLKGQIANSRKKGVQEASWCVAENKICSVLLYFVSWQAAGNSNPVQCLFADPNRPNDGFRALHPGQFDERFDCLGFAIAE